MITPGIGMDLPRALGILRDVAAALDYAHANGVVHRDIKPANILIGDSGHAMVADFGIARAFGGDSANTATATGVVGSPAYMSPEQWRGEKVDGRADQYALGVLAFELLTGKRPFADSSMQELLRMHLAEDPPDIVSFRQDLPSHTTDAVWHAMAKDPADRFVTSAAFVDALSGAAPPRQSKPRIAPPMPPCVSSAQATVKHLTPQPARVRTAPVPQMAATAPAAKSPWLVIVLLLLLGGVGGAIVVAKVNKNAAAKLAATTAAASAASAAFAGSAASPASDSIAALQKAEATENARLQKEVEDAKNIALAAEHQLEIMKAEKAKAAVAAAAGASAAAPPAEPPHAHIVVLARGGTPQVLIDGQQTVNNAPTVVEVRPGHHVVTVRGAAGNRFQPSEYALDLAQADTQTVVFVSLRAGQNKSALTPQQRLRYQKMQRAMDSTRMLKKPPE